MNQADATHAAGTSSGQSQPPAAIAERSYSPAEKVKPASAPDTSRSQPIEFSGRRVVSTAPTRPRFAGRSRKIRKKGIARTSPRSRAAPVSSASGTSATATIEDRTMVATRARRDRGSGAGDRPVDAITAAGGRNLCSRRHCPTRSFRECYDAGCSHCAASHFDCVRLNQLPESSGTAPLGRLGHWRSIDPLPSRDGCCARDGPAVPARPPGAVARPALARHDRHRAGDAHDRRPPARPAPGRRAGAGPRPPGARDRLPARRLGAAVRAAPVLRGRRLARGAADRGAAVLPGGDGPRAGPAPDPPDRRGAPRGGRRDADTARGRT